eukprot:7960964-Alexandrium_andersonii.AAC.1
MPTGVILPPLLTFPAPSRLSTSVHRIQLLHLFAVLIAAKVAWKVRGVECVGKDGGTGGQGRRARSARKVGKVHKE